MRRTFLWEQNGGQSIDPPLTSPSASATPWPPRPIHLGDYYEIDGCALEQEDGRSNGVPALESNAEDDGLVTATYAPPQPTLVLDADLDDQYQYEVLVFDRTRGRQLVAAIEIVSPANRDRPENRRAFVAKCAALLQQPNLYCDLLALIGRSDPSFDPPPAVYAVTCRAHKVGRQSRFVAWAYPLAVGRELPALPM